MPRHRHWPVTMQAGGVVLRPMRRADEARWTTTRELDWDWLGPWEATKPPGSHERVGGYRMMIARNRRRAKEGTFLPWAIGWDDGWPDRPALNRDTTPLIGQLTVSSISLGSAMSCSMGYWVASAYAGRGGCTDRGGVGVRLRLSGYGIAPRRDLRAAREHEEFARR